MLFPHLAKYLADSNWLASLQFVVFVAVTWMLADRSLRALGWLHRPLAAGEPVAGAVVDGLTQFCVGLGLLLTFSGLYGYIDSGEVGDQAALLMALGSSALGYSAWTLCAAATVVDGLRSGAVGTDAPTFAPDARAKFDGAAAASGGRKPAGLRATRRRKASRTGRLTPAARPVPIDTIRVGRPKAADADDDWAKEVARAFESEDETYHEQETTSDPGGGGGLMGGAVCDVDPGASCELGSLDGYQRPLGTGDDLGRDADSDLGPGGASGVVAGGGPAADARSSPPPPGGNGRPATRPPGGPFTV